MSDWKYRTLAEANDEIERLQDDNGLLDAMRKRQNKEIERLQKRNVLLEGVAVAADTYLADHHNESEQALFDALDKLREVSDE